MSCSKGITLFKAASLPEVGIKMFVLSIRINPSTAETAVSILSMFIDLMGMLLILAINCNPSKNSFLY